MALLKLRQNKSKLNCNIPKVIVSFCMLKLTKLTFPSSVSSVLSDEIICSQTIIFETMYFWHSVLNLPRMLPQVSKWIDVFCLTLSLKDSIIPVGNIKCDIFGVTISLRLFSIFVSLWNFREWVFKDCCVLKVLLQILHT